MTKFDSNTCHKIIQALEAGNYQKTAAALAGVSENTFYRWMDRGKNAKSGKYREFCESVKRAEEKAKAYHLQQIRKASENGSWQASAWYLERKHPSEWGRQQRIEMDAQIKADVKGTVQVQTETRLQRLRRIEAEQNDRPSDDTAADIQSGTTD